MADQPIDPLSLRAMAELLHRLEIAGTHASRDAVTALRAQRAEIERLSGILTTVEDAYRTLTERLSREATARPDAFTRLIGMAHDAHWDAIAALRGTEIERLAGILAAVENAYRSITQWLSREATIRGDGELTHLIGMAHDGGWFVTCNRETYRTHVAARDAVTVLYERKTPFPVELIPLLGAP
jgi:hypothetical protein